MSKYEVSNLVFGHQVEKVFTLGGLGAPGRGQVRQGQRAGKGGVVAAVVEGPVLVGAVVQAWTQGHVPEQALGGHGHQAKGHAQAAGHGQHDVLCLWLGIAGGGRAHGGFAFQGGVGVGRGKQQNGQTKQQTEAQAYVRHRG